jgi:hypothetical protein
MRDETYEFAQSDRWRRYRVEIRRILMEQWHPIKFPVPDDEYDDYARTITDMLTADGYTVVEIADYLSDVEAEIMHGMRVDPVPIARASESLVALRAKLG